MIDVYLASRSPRRRALLRQIGVSYEVLGVRVDESAHATRAPAQRARALAEDKARAGWAHRARRLERPVLGADTLIDLDGEALGKPSGRAEALSMLARLSGREHLVHTGIAVAQQERCTSRVVSTRVRLRASSAGERDAYWDSGEPLDKAGAYGIQGRGVLLTERIEGSWSNVVGLPLELLPELFRHVGVDLLALLDGTPER